MEAPLIAIVLVLMGYAFGSTKMISEGNEALVERLGRYHRKLSPGLNFIVPLVDMVVMEDTVREQVLDIKPQQVITADNVTIEVDGVVFWSIIDMEKSFYKIDDIQIALANLVTVELRATIAGRSLEQTIASRNEMNQALLEVLNRDASEWGVKIIRVDIQSINPPENIKNSLSEQNAAVIRKRALITAAEGEQEAAVKRAQATSTAMEILSQTLRANPESKEILQYLVAQEQVEASQKLGESNNAKIVFLNPGVLSKDTFDQVLGEMVANPDGNGISEQGKG